MVKQRTALVTGASTGFGYLTAESLVREGLNVYATMRDTAKRNAEPKAKLEAQGITVFELDVTSPSSVDALAKTVLKDGGTIDILINNAGTAHLGVTEAFTPESAEKQFATNLFGPMRLNRAFLPTMRKQSSGLIIFVSSVVGRFVFPFGGIYAGSKFALEAYAESLSYELRPSGVDIALVEPGPYATNIMNVGIHPDDPARIAEYGDTVKFFDAMMQGLGSMARDPQEVADAIVALVKQPAGSRPLRTVVPNEGPAVAVNQATEPIQRAVIAEFGFGDLLPKVAANA